MLLQKLFLLFSILIVIAIFTFNKIINFSHIVHRRIFILFVIHFAIEQLIFSSLYQLRKHYSNLL